MMFANDDSLDPQAADSENDNQRRRRRRSIRGGFSLTRIIGGEDSPENRWPWQISITKNSGMIPDPMIRIGNSGCGILFFYVI